MQRHAYLINTARGEIIDEPALIAALQERRIAGAGLDVFEHEPAVDARLLAMRHVVLLPHLVSATIEGRLAMGDKVMEIGRASCRERASQTVSVSVVTVTCKKIRKNKYSTYRG